MATRTPTGRRFTRPTFIIRWPCWHSTGTTCGAIGCYTGMLGLDLYLNGLGNEGGCDEGPSYWFVAGGSVFDALELLHSATHGKVDIYREPLIRNMASYVYKMHIDRDYFVDFADADPTLKPDGLMLYRFGKRIQDDTLVQFGKWAYGTYGTSALSGSAGQFRRQRRLDDLLTMNQIGPVANTTFDAQAVSEKTTAQATSLSMNIAKAYPAEAGIQRWNRTVLLNRAAETVTITDEYVLTQPPTSLQQVFMTVCPVDSREPGKLAFQTPTGQLILRYNATAWKVSTETVPLTTPEDATLSAKWGGKAIQRIMLTGTAPTNKGKSVFTIARL